MMGAHHGGELAAAAVLFLMIRVVLAMVPRRAQARFIAR